MEKNAASRILLNYSKLSPVTREAIVPAIKDIASISLFSSLDNREIKVEPENLHDVSIQIMQGIRTTRTVSNAALGTLFFVLAFAGALLNLPSFLKLKEQSIFVKTAWRYVILLLLLLPKFAYDVCSDVAGITNLVITNIGSILALSALHTAYVYMVYFAVQHTFVAHTLLLCSIATTFLATWKIARKDQYTSLEYLGVGINVFGAYLCCCEGAPIPRTLR